MHVYEGTLFQADEDPPSARMFAFALYARRISVKEGVLELVLALETPTEEIAAELKNGNLHGIMDNGSREWKSHVEKQRVVWSMEEKPEPAHPASGHRGFHLSTLFHASAEKAKEIAVHIAGPGMLEPHFSEGILESVEENIYTCFVPLQPSSDQSSSCHRAAFCLL